MTKNEIMNDPNFRKACIKYGLNWQDFDLITLQGSPFFADDDFAILLHQPESNIYVVLDRYYQTVAIEPCDWLIDNQMKSHFTATRYFRYWTFTDETSLGGNFGYPFEEFTLRDIMNLSRQIKIDNQSTSLNGLTITDSTQAKLLSYVKYLGISVDEYFQTKFHLETLGIESPSVYTYLKQLNTNLNRQINKYFSTNTRPYPIDIASSLGQVSSLPTTEPLLEDIISVLTLDQGKVINPKDSHQLIDSTEDIATMCLSEQAKELLDITSPTKTTGQQLTFTNKVNN